MARLPIPWPAALAAAALAGLLFGLPRSSGAPDPMAAIAAASLVLLAILVQLRLRLTAGNRWAADAATLALVLGSPLLLFAEASSPLPTSALLLFCGFMLAGPTASGGSLRTFAAAILWSSCVILSPLFAPAVAALWAWSLFASSHRGGPLFGGSFIAAGRRLLVLLPALFAAAFVLLPSGLVSLAPAGLTEVFLASWPRPCGCAAAAIDSAETTSILRSPLLAVPWLILALPGLALVLRRFEQRREAVACLLVLVAQVGFATFVAIGDRGDVGGGASLFAGAMSGAALTKGGGSIPDGWSPIATGSWPALPFALIFVAGAMAWLRNRPALSGPRTAGLAAGLVSASIFLNSWALVLGRRDLPAVGLAALVAAAGAGALTVALLFPGAASLQGRLTAAGLALAAAVPIVFYALA